MIRTLAHLRLLVSVLILSMTIVMGVAPSMVSATDLCDKAAVSSHDATAAVSMVQALHHEYDQGHPAQTGDCCTPCVVSHCCAGVVPATADATALPTVTALTWRPDHLSGAAGLGPFGDLRPPRRIG